VSPRLGVDVEDGPYQPGDVVEGRVTVLEGGSSRTLEVFLRFVERSPSYSETPLSIGTGPLHSGDLRDQASYRFQLRLPEGSLPNYESEHGRLQWVIDACSDEKFQPDTHEAVPIDVVAVRASPR
jgi:hypothetical protein